MMMTAPSALWRRNGAIRRYASEAYQARAKSMRGNAITIRSPVHSFQHVNLAAMDDELPIEGRERGIDPAQIFDDVRSHGDIAQMADRVSRHDMFLSLLCVGPDNCVLSSVRRLHHR